MNILLFVTSMLMILSFLTYARIDTFRYTLGVQAEFERYMRSLERVYINNSAKQWYNSTIAKGAGGTTPTNPGSEPPKKSDPTKTTPDKTKTPAAGEPTKPTGEPTSPSGTPTSRMSIRVLIDPKMRATNEQAYSQTAEWIKRLMQELYGEQQFFKRALLEQPNFIDDLIKELANAVQALPDNKRPKHAEDLSNITLHSDFEEVFYLMLKGCPREDLLSAKLSKETFRPAVTLPTEETGQQDDETDAANEAQESLTNQGYNSLLNYISLRNTTKIRIYLASRDLLTAIFGQTSIADDIIRMRYSLYRSVISNGMPSEDASKQFQSAFQGLALGDSGSMLDFKITKTNPNDYN